MQFLLLGQETLFKILLGEINQFIYRNLTFSLAWLQHNIKTNSLFLLYCRKSSRDKCVRDGVQSGVPVTVCRACW